MTTLCLSSVIALTASDRPAKRQLSPRCKTPVVPHTHTPHASDRPAKKQLSPRDAILAAVPQLHLMACANHEARRLPLLLSPLLCRWPCSAHHLSPTRALHSPKTRPKCERLQRASPALARPPHLEQASLHTPHATCFPPRLLPG